MKKINLAVAISLASSSLVAIADNSSPSYSSNVIDIANRCIVRFADDHDRVYGSVQGLVTLAQAKGHEHARAEYIYSNSIKGFTVNISCTAAEKAFAKASGIVKFSPDSLVTMYPGPPGSGGGSDAQVTPYGIARVGGPVDGTGMDAWVLDTGIDLDHPDLNVDGSRGFTAFTSGPSAGVIDDDHGHGTHVAGSIGAINNDIDVVGVAANATVIPVKVLDKRGSGTTSGVIAGVDYVGANASPGDCANMSLGGGVSQDLDDAVVAASEASGAFFVLAAGNDGDDANNHSPARANGANVRTISATDDTDTFASWSNYGNPPVDYAAPGVSILSTAMGGGTTTKSGTSMASPHACAVMMLTNGNPKTDGNAVNDPDGNPDPIIHL